MMCGVGFLDLLNTLFERQVFFYISGVLSKALCANLCVKEMCRKGKKPQMLQKGVQLIRYVTLGGQASHAGVLV